jgi:uncharacterized membrane protein
MSARVAVLSRRILLGRDEAWGARLGTAPTAIYLLAGLVILLHVLDLVTGLRMMLTYGTHLEQNPLPRFVMLYAGPVGLIALKLAVVISGVLLFVRTAQLGRARLARNCLLVAAAVGMLGAASNLVS